MCVCVFFIPETGGRTFIEIDELYERAIPAWKWKQTEILTVPQGKIDQEE
jgi:hypothetical protein